MMLAIGVSAVMGLWLGDIVGEGIRNWTEQRKKDGKKP